MNTPIPYEETWPAPWAPLELPSSHFSPTETPDLSFLQHRFAYYALHLGFYTVCSLLCQTSFAQNDVCGIHPYCCRWFKFVYSFSLLHSIPFDPAILFLKMCLTYYNFFWSIFKKISAAALFFSFQPADILSSSTELAVFLFVNNTSPAFCHGNSLMFPQFIKILLDHRT